MSEALADEQRPEQQLVDQDALQVVSHDTAGQASSLESNPDDTIDVYQYTTKEGVTYRSHDPAVIGKLCRHIAMLPEPVREVMLQQHKVQMSRTAYEASLQQDETAKDHTEPQSKTEKKDEAKEKESVSALAVVQPEHAPKIQLAEKPIGDMKADNEVEEPLQKSEYSPDKVSTEGTGVPSITQLAELVERQDRLYRLANEQYLAESKLAEEGSQSKGSVSETEHMTNENDVDRPSAQTAEERVSHHGEAVETVFPDLGQPHYDRAENSGGAERLDVVDDFSAKDMTVSTVELSDVAVENHLEWMIADKHENESEGAAELEVMTAFEGMHALEPVFDEAETQAVDEQIELVFAADYKSPSGFDGMLSETIEQERRPALTAEILTLSAERMAERQPEKTEALSQAMGRLEEYVEEVVELLDKSIAEGEIIEARQRLEDAVRELFVLLEKPANEKIIKRIAERLIQEKVQERAILQREQAVDNGTREQKHFKDDLLWLGSSYIRHYLVKVLGMRALKGSWYPI